MSWKDRALKALSATRTFVRDNPLIVSSTLATASALASSSYGKWARDKQNTPNRAAVSVGLALGAVVAGAGLEEWADDTRQVSPAELFQRSALASVGALVGTTYAELKGPGGPAPEVIGVGLALGSVFAVAGTPPDGIEPPTFTQAPNPHGESGASIA